jgi:hypothetical protein
MNSRPPEGSAAIAALNAGVLSLTPVGSPPNDRLLDEPAMVQ